MPIIKATVNVQWQPMNQDNFLLPDTCMNCGCVRIPLLVAIVRSDARTGFADS
jgi:hypothetical protein